VEAGTLVRGRLRLREALRWLAPAVYVAALTIAIWRDGIPAARERLLLWIVLGLLAFSITNVRGWGRSVVLEWLPFALILWAYDILRGQADGLLFDPYTRPQLDADRVLGLGTAPTVFLQEHLWHGSLDLRWWDYGAWLVYTSYFLATYLLAAALWFFARDRFRPYVATVTLLALMGFVTYALFPAVPPWLASVEGALEPTTRSIGLISAHVPVIDFSTLFERGSEYANPVAAVPSLHAAYALLIALYLWRLVPRWARVPLAAYPIAMAAALVYSGEHYVSDCLLGWVYAVAAFAAVELVRARVSFRRPAVALAAD
jgi:membrane-associated phospholipid phosphatase